MPARKSALLGKWRIVGMELWDTDFVDMLEPAYITFWTCFGKVESSQ